MYSVAALYMKNQVRSAKRKMCKPWTAVSGFWPSSHVHVLVPVAVLLCQYTLLSPKCSSHTLYGVLICVYIHIQPCWETSPYHNSSIVVLVLGERKRWFPLFFPIHTRTNPSLITFFHHLWTRAHTHTLSHLHTHTHTHFSSSAAFALFSGTGHKIRKPHHRPLSLWVLRQNRLCIIKP